MNRDVIAQLAQSLHARLFAQFLAACTDMSIPGALDVSEVALKHQEHYTALDWIIATRRACQLRLPARAQSLVQQERKTQLEDLARKAVKQAAAHPGNTVTKQIAKGLVYKITVRRDKRMNPLSKYLAWLHYTAFESRYGYLVALSRAFEHQQLHQQWCEGLLISAEVLRLYWNLQV